MTLTTSATALTVELSEANCSSDMHHLLSGQHFSQLDQIAEWVGKESEPAADGRQDEGLGDDFDAACAKLGDRFIDTRNVEAEMVVAAIFQAITEVGIGAHFARRRVDAAEHLDVEMIVCRWRQVG